MLSKNSVEPATLSLLEELMQMPELNNFDLVGGTALALKFGHRKSVDLDLFSIENFEVEKSYRSFHNDSEIVFVLKKQTLAGQYSATYKMSKLIS